MAEERKIIRQYDKYDNDADKFNKQIAKAVEEGWLVDNIDYKSVSDGAAACFIAYLIRDKKETVAPSETAYDLLQHFKMVWCGERECGECPFSFSCGSCCVINAGLGKVAEHS